MISLWLILSLLLTVPASAQNGQAVIGSPAPKVLTFTRDLTVATGSVAYTGCGFSPRLLQVFGGINGSSNFTTLNGMASSGGVQGAVGLFGANTQVNLAANTFLNFGDATFSNSQSATVASYDADGFTLSWVKNGVPTGTVTFYIACMK